MTRSRDDGIPTPKQSGSLQRAPVFAALAQGIEKLMAEHETRFVGRGPQGLAELDIQLARQCRALGKRAGELRKFFESWETSDPGPEARLSGVMRLRDLETEAKPFMPAF